MNHTPLSVTSAKGKTTIVRLLVHVYRDLRHNTLRVDTDGHYINNRQRSARKDEIPLSVKKMALAIVHKLSIFPYANYSLDFIFTDRRRPLLVEMNTAPGFDLLHIVGNEKIKKKNFEEFIAILQ